MAVHAEDGLVGIGHVVDDVTDERAEFVGLGEAHGVGNVDGGGTGVDGGGDDAHEEVTVGAGGVFGGEFHVGGVGGGALHGGHGKFHHFVGGLAQLVFHVDGRGGDEGVNARMAGELHGFPGAVDVLGVGAGKTGDLRVLHVLGNGLHGFEVAFAGRGEARLDDVDAQHFQLAGDADLFTEVHGGAGGLFPVAERGIENNDAVGHGFLLAFSGRISGPAAFIPAPPRTRRTEAIKKAAPTSDGTAFCQSFVRNHDISGHSSRPDSRPQRRAHSSEDAKPASFFSAWAAMLRTFIMISPAFTASFSEQYEMRMFFSRKNVTGNKKIRFPLPRREGFAAPDLPRSAPGHRFSARKKRRPTPVRRAPGPFGSRTCPSRAAAPASRTRCASASTAARGRGWRNARRCGSWSRRRYR